MKKKSGFMIKLISSCLIAGGIFLITGYILNGASWKNELATARPWYQVVQTGDQESCDD